MMTTKLLTYLVLNLSDYSWKVYLLLKHIALLVQLNRLSPVVEGAGYENLICLARPADRILAMMPLL
jgi:hypothetical protein